MKLSTKQILASSAALFAAVLLILISGKSCRRETKILPNNPVRLREVRYTKVFNDLNDLQLSVASKVGIEPPEDRDEAASMRGRLVEIVPGPLYDIDTLTYSVPYLTKNSAALLQRIGENFRDSLAAKGLNPNKLIVTSILRTKDDVARLRKAGNINASPNSTHCHGTTFDIAYGRYSKVQHKNRRYEYEDVPPEKLKMVLGEVLRDLRAKEFCYVKYEKKQHCFHITSRR